MNEEIKGAILEKIREYPVIMLFRHTRMDGDCAGASKGLKEILKASFPDKTVLLPDAQHSDELNFLGPDDENVPEETYKNALGIVVDTAERGRISNPRYALCREIVKIDHHIQVDAYGTLNWVEEDRSSVCEMVAQFYADFSSVFKLPVSAAAFLYLGMVTDSGRFGFSGVTGDTLRLAGMLLDAGIDTETLFARLYLMDFQAVKFKATVLEHMERTENGVAFIRISREMQARFSLTPETAGAAISYLENIQGCLCWLAFIENEREADGIRVRLRSRFMTIHQVAERYHGGGHARAAGATVYSENEMRALIREADEETKHYKGTHTGWL